jgi:hypothetical protein
MFADGETPWQRYLPMDSESGWSQEVRLKPVTTPLALHALIPVRLD